MKLSSTLRIGLFLMLHLAAIAYYCWLFFYWGKTNLGTTIVLYLTLGLLCWALLNILNAWGFLKKQAQDIQVVLFTLLIALFGADLSLKYIFKMGLSYGEQNGKNYYSSRYLKPGILKQINSGSPETKLRTKTPNSQQQMASREYTYMHRYNSLGLRERAFNSLHLDSSKFKILCLGDSFTEGVGTHQDSTWVRFLETALQPTYQNLVTLNGATFGSDPVYEYMKLKTLFLPYKPDLVILTINSTDLGDLYYRGGFDRYEGAFYKAHSPWWEIFYGSSYLFRNFMRGVLGYKGHLLSPKQTKIVFQKAEKILLESLNRFAELCRLHQIKFLLIIRPQYVEIKNSTFPLINVEKALISEGNIQILNLMKLYLEKGIISPQNAQEYYWPIDRHHNVKGYQVWAEVVKDYLVENNLIHK